MTKEEKNKKLVIDALHEAFNLRDYSAFERYWSPKYIQHAAHLLPGRDGLRDAIKNSPSDFKFEYDLILAEGDYVMIHVRYSNTGADKHWIGVDIFRIENNLLAEHWDVLQNEASFEESKSGLPMFGHTFPVYDKK